MWRSPEDARSGVRRLGQPAPIRWTAVLLILITVLQLETMFVPWGLFLPVLAAVAVFSLWRVRSELRSPTNVFIAGCLFAGSLLVATGPSFIIPGFRSVNLFARPSTAVTAAWIFFLLLLPRSHPRGHEVSTGERSRRVNGWLWPAGIVAGAFVLLAAGVRTTICHAATHRRSDTPSIDAPDRRERRAATFLARALVLFSLERLQVPSSSFTYGLLTTSVDAIVPALDNLRPALWVAVFAFLVRGAHRSAFRRKVLCLTPARI